MFHNIHSDAVHDALSQTPLFLNFPTTYYQVSLEMALGQDPGTGCSSSRNLLLQCISMSCDVFQASFFKGIFNVDPQLRYFQGIANVFRLTGA